MSYYEHRNASGEFTDLMGVHAGEQWGAGVNQYDNHLTAYQKVVNRRYALGLDPATGFPPSPYVATGTGATSGYYGGSAAPAGTGWLGAAFAWCVKWLVAVPLAVAALMLSVLAASAWANAAWRDSGPGRGLAARVAHEIAPGATLSEPARHLSGKPLAAALAIDGAAPVPLGTKASQARLAAAYLCQLEPACAARAERALGWRAFDLGEVFLLERAKAGSAGAASEMCLLPLLAGSGVDPIRRARLACEAVSRQARFPETEGLRRALDASWTAALARPVFWAASTFCVEPRGSGCRLEDAPAKVEYAARAILMGRAPW